MRFLMGVIVGIVLTIKAAFIADSLATEAAPGAEPRQSVGTLLGDEFHEFTQSIRAGWNKLIHSFQRADA
jgi:hypothetical protein